MVDVTYHVAIAFTRSPDGAIVAIEPREARSAEQAIGLARSLAATGAHCGALAFSRTGDPSSGEFQDAIVLKPIGDVDEALLTSTN